jgi:hypothetical protein
MTTDTEPTMQLEIYKRTLLMLEREKAVVELDEPTGEFKTEYLVALDYTLDMVRQNIARLSAGSPSR